MKFLQEALWLIITTGIVTAGFLLPLPDSRLPDITPRSQDKITPTTVPSSKPWRQYSPETLSRIFEVKILPAAVKIPTPPEEPAGAVPSPEPAPPRPPLPPLRYVGEAQIRGRRVYYLMAGRPEKLVRLTEESEGEYRLISTTEDELLIEFEKRSTHVPKK